MGRTLTSLLLKSCFRLASVFYPGGPCHGNRRHCATELRKKEKSRTTHGYLFRGSFGLSACFLFSLVRVRQHAILHSQGVHLPRGDCNDGVSIFQTAGNHVVFRKRTLANSVFGETAITFSRNARKHTVNHVQSGAIETRTEYIGVNVVFFLFSPTCVPCAA